MARLPQPGGDRGSWGNVLNDFLAVEHNTDGSLKNSGSLGAYAPLTDPVFSGTVTVPNPTSPTDAVTKSYADNLAASGVADASATDKGKIQLTGDLTGSAGSPAIAVGAVTDSKVSGAANISQTKIAGLTVDLASKETPAGAQAKVNTHAAASDPHGDRAFTTSQLSSYALLVNPTFTGAVTVPEPVYASDAATKQYVDDQIGSGAPDATITEKGKIQLSGDLSGTANSPEIAVGVIDNANINASAAIAQSKIANLTTDLAGKETPAGAQSKVDSHIAASDPHGDRVYTDSQIGTINIITPGPGLYMDDLGGNMFELGFDGSMYLPGTGISFVDNGNGTSTINSTGTAIVPVFFFDETPGGLETYTFPTGARFWRYDLAGGAGGGGSGRRGAPGTLCYGGGAGQAGATYSSPVMRIPATTIRYSLGAGGTGGAAVTTNDTNGNNGVNGGESYVGNGNLVRLVSVSGGEAGQGGSATGALGGGRILDGFGIFNVVHPSSSMFGSNGSGPADASLAGLGLSTTAVDTTQALIEWTMYMSSRGLGSIAGGGGGIKTDNSASTPGPGINSFGGSDGAANRDGSVAWRLAGAAGSDALKNGGAPGAHAFGFALREEVGWGSAGGGGYPGISTAAGAGGSGVGHGDAAGGGGASRNGFNSGAGGNGSPGFIRIWCW